MDTWCTVEDVLTYTGVQVDSDVLLQAGGTIDVAAGRPYEIDGAADPSRIGSRDRYWLKLACAYQAGWLSTQVDAFNRIDALDISQGRARTQLRDTALVLAPHARKTLKRVSWLKTRSLHVRSAFTDGVGGSLSPLASAADGYAPWSPV